MRDDAAGPGAGLVICYSYRWHKQHQAGAYEGREARPCAIVVATTDDDGDTKVYVAPITHPRLDDIHAVEIPHSIKQRHGLDDQPSWIVTSELNRFT